MQLLFDGEAYMKTGLIGQTKINIQASDFGGELDSDGQDKTVGSVLSTECGTAKAAHPRDEDGGEADEHGVYAALGSKSDPGEVSTPGIAV